MYKTLVTSALLLLVTSAIAQFGYTEPNTNSEDSEYKFKEVARLESTPVEDQGNTGTCWSFSTLSFFESELIRMGTKEPVLLSEMFVARKAYEGKLEKFVRMDGKMNFSEGGIYHDIPWVIKNYGIVPMEVYTGLNSDQEEHDHSELIAVLSGYAHGLKSHLGRAELSTVWQDGFNGILDAYLGEDIEQFEMEGETYTPISYAEKIGLDMDNYVSITSFTNHELYKPCILAIPDNWAWGQCHNVTLDELMNSAEHALKGGYTIAWDADVSEDGFNNSEGIAINPVDERTLFASGNDDVEDAFRTPVAEIEVTAEIRQRDYDNKRTTDDHLMHIVGLYTDQNGTKYFLVKNSWGTENFPKGFLYVSESYFKAKTISIYMHEGALSKDLNKKLGL